VAGEDFVHIQLSAAGVKMAGTGGQVRITAGRGSFVFVVGQSQRVTKAYEWNVLLKNERFQGQPILELTAAAAPATSSSSSSARVVVHPAHGPVMGPGLPPEFGVQRHPAIAAVKEK
jgi:hypothetical protein